MQIPFADFFNGLSLFPGPEAPRFRAGVGVAWNLNFSEKSLIDTYTVSGKANVIEMSVGIFNTVSTTPR